MPRWIPLAFLVALSLLLASTTHAAAGTDTTSIAASASFTWTFPSDSQGWWMNRSGLGSLNGQAATWNAGRLSLDWPDFGGSYAWVSAWPPMLTTPLSGTQGRLRFQHQVTGAFPNVEYRACLIGRPGAGLPFKVACTPVRPIGAASVEIQISPGQGEWTTEGNWPNGSTVALPEGELAQVLRGWSRIYLQYRYGGALCTDPDQVRCQWVWNTTTIDDVELAVWGPTAEASFDTPNAMTGDVVMLVARVRDEDGNIVRSSSEITATLTGSAQPITLDDAVRRSDVKHGDGYHTALVTVPAGQTTVNATIYWQGTELTSATLAVIADPRLAVITDFNRLANAFVAAGHASDEDTDADGRSDFYELVDRLARYASAHRAIVYDLSHNVTTARGFSANYADYNYAAGQAAPMSGLAFQFITSIHSRAQYAVTAVALIGSDEVVPLYRMPYPLNDAKVLASDVPYMFSRYTDPVAVPHPVPQTPAGRVFAPSPGQLSAAIDAYEQPLTIGATGAALLCIDEKQGLIQWDNICRTLVGPRLAWHYPGATAIYREAVAAWGVNDVLKEFQRSSATVLYSHADMTRNGLPGDQLLTAFDVRTLPDSAGKLVLNAGCWSGNHPAYSSGGGNDGLVQAALDRHLTYAGPTDTGVGGNYTLVWDDYIWMHFLDALWQPRYKTVGAAWVAAWNGYYQAQDSQFYEEMDWDIDGNPRLFTTSQAYAKSLTGLPTQPILRPGQVTTINAEPVSGPEPAAPAAPDAVRTETITLDIPNYRWTTWPDGAQQALPATGGESWGRLGLPVLPAMRYQVSLPPQVTEVTVEERRESRQVEGVGVVHLITEGTDIRCDCAAPGLDAPSRTITDTYPLRLWTAGITTLPNESQLNLFTVLGQVDSHGALTLTHHIEFTVSYTQPATGVTLGALTVNNNAPIRTDTAAVPVQFSVTADRARAMLLAYVLTGPDGMIVAANSSTLAAKAGAEDVTLTLDARGWPAGPLNLQVTASDGETDAAAVLDVRGAALRVVGLGLDATLVPVRIEQGHAGELTLTAWDESGAPVDGLENRFAVSVDQLPATINIERVSPGRYRALLPTGALSGGSHTLNIDATDARDLSAQAEVAFGVSVPLRVRAYLPLLLREAFP